MANTLPEDSWESDLEHGEGTDWWGDLRDAIALIRELRLQLAATRAVNVELTAERDAATAALTEPSSAWAVVTSSVDRGVHVSHVASLWSSEAAALTAAQKEQRNTAWDHVYVERLSIARSTGSRLALTSHNAQETP